jgi:hypothetical protein
MGQILTLAQVVGILDRFNVEHINYMDDGNGELGGMVIRDRNLIQLSRNGPQALRYFAVLHELVHAKELNLEGTSSERGMDKKTRQAFYETFGYHFKG